LSWLGPSYVADVQLCLSLLAKYVSYLTGSVGYKSFYTNPIMGMQWYLLVKKPFCLPRFLAAQMAFAAFGTQNLAGTGNVKAAPGPFMCFKFWHPDLSLSLPLF
jgi:hypothetical protein